MKKGQIYGNRGSAIYTCKSGADLSDLYFLGTLDSLLVSAFRV